ncbi:unnamed protein product [Blepharisma stoltei]|uniref:Uncharacterized protein n=1 Tax=Blepharisma stoltei TaxID=1481888 RepID=A0AAU9IIK6_9CILI|nr:unnamed protein product [Blepharisma stoltei]
MKSLAFNKFSNLWWVMFQGFQLATIGIIAWALWSDNWVKLNVSGVYGDLKWTGSLTKVHKGLRALQGSSYYEMFTAFCSTTEKSQDVPDEESTWCEMFAQLWISELIYIVLGVITVCAIVIWIISLRSALKTNKIKPVPAFWFAQVAWISHEIAFISWMVLAKANFSGDCTSESDDDSPPKLCALTGPILGLILAIILPIMALSYSLLIRYLPKPIEAEHVVQKESEGALKETPIK